MGPQRPSVPRDMVVEEICRQLGQRGIGFDAYYYRTGGDAEVDLVIEGMFGLVAVEIKLGQRVRAQELRGSSRITIAASASCSAMRRSRG